MLIVAIRFRTGGLKARSHGMSLVELMVGIAVGLILVAGALTLFSSHVIGSRALVRETRLNQDLRAAADLIARDLRRAGYWANSISGVTNSSAASAAAVSNPYAGTTGTFGGANSQVNYNFTRDTDNSLDTNEQFGFRLCGGAIQIQTSASGTTNCPAGAPVAGTWQSVTDPDIMTVTRFQITNVATNIAVGDMCTSGCNTTPPASAPTASCPSPPTLRLDRFDILIEANASNDATLRRTLRESVRLRNSRISGSCP